MPDINYLLLAVISLLGAGTLIIVYRHMNKGFGPYNLRIIGIVLIATFAWLLAIKDDKALSAAMGILGAIGGYLFGLKPTPKKKRSPPSGGSASGRGAP